MFQTKITLELAKAIGSDQQQTQASLQETWSIEDIEMHEEQGDDIAAKAKY
jgi:hypothetical protein